MKKIVIILLMVLVVGIVGFYAYNELRVREIVYVNDTLVEGSANRSAVKRLYSSDVDMEKYNALLEQLISLEFTEEDILHAALESGTPEFYPAFHTGVYRESTKDDEEEGETGNDAAETDEAAEDEPKGFFLRSRVIQELAEGQERTNFRLANLRLEVITNGVTIDEVTAQSTDTLNNTVLETPLVNEQGTGMTVFLKNCGDTEIAFLGTDGTIVLQYVYDVESVSLFPTTVMTNCFIRINVRTSADEEGNILAEYTVDNATTVEEYMEEE
ncbi:MAG: hypothetical protein NC084_08995 [Bacteroides sp.]|nr:hypothetical protein [Eubacterium sp.]MCM1418350.1 hypothetical protein [Roseburia sp.]MCM1462832.1 hypothetical protein [Bacteroides sp.]